MASRHLTIDELNQTALEHFVYQPVNNDMIAFLAHAAQNVISCDPTTYSRSKNPPTPPRTPEADAEDQLDKSLPSVEDFIRQLVVSSNVQVPTLMASLVYLTRLKARLQPQARGIRCTTHRIFLASLILAAKYLNDSSPKNKHWAKYSHISTKHYNFGFDRTEVNTMEKQLLFLLEWDLRIHEEHLYAELDYFLEPLREKILDRHQRKMQEREDKLRQNEMSSAARRYPSPASSREGSRSRSRHAAREHTRATSSGSTPGLIYSSSASSYASSISSRQQSRATTPLDYAEPDAYAMMAAQGSLCESPVHVYAEEHSKRYRSNSGGRLPYEISEQEYQQLQDDGSSKKRQKRGVLGRWFGATAVR
ncbi:uncharacterized protein J7T54_006575 [Emericellopsis cladophorae]|uniref:Cyclin N-terminal domain-containing protein n=1 Tax=Emericellopsis cladophorae TaxID=2686198 RepID=A0A9P9Y7Q9_9HYPO|nr:uncharacterized protein J7T54_006575 [Emericellopsis cladophorae]KAI6784530.1 hypothetical protein J7T54_006575 [Emericellopsis cladophorae]